MSVAIRLWGARYPETSERTTNECGMAVFRQCVAVQQRGQEGATTELLKRREEWNAMS